MSSRYFFLGYPVETTRELDLPPWQGDNSTGACRLIETHLGEIASTPLWHWPKDGDPAYLAVAKHRTGWRITFNALEFCCDVSFDGLEIRLPKSTVLDRRSVNHLLLNAVLPYAAGARGLNPLHAGAVEHGGRTAVFAGATGQGKSTLVGALHKLGARALTDDCLTIENHDAGFRVVPGYPGLRLWPGTCRALSIDMESARPAAGYCSKLALDGLFDPWPQEEQWPNLAAIFLLAPHRAARSDHDWVRPVRRVDAFRTLLEATFRIDTADRAANAAEFAFLSRLLVTTPVYELSHPRDYDRLPEVWELVKGQLANLTLQQVG